MNEVFVEIDDASKTLIVEETLTSGSKYRIVVKDGAARVGAGDLIITVPPQLAVDLPLALREPRPAVAALAHLAAGGQSAEGELNTSTDVLQALATKRPRLETVFPCVLHSNTNGENVATGFVRIRLCRVASGEPTGAAILYRGPQGERGETGEKGEKGEDGQDGEPGPQGMRGERGPQGTRGPTGPHGERGPANAETKYVKCEETGKWHLVRAKHNVFGKAVLTVDEEEQDLLPDDVKGAVEGLFGFSVGADGHLYLTKTERASDLEFEIDGNGHLVMDIVTERKGE